MLHGFLKHEFLKGRGRFFILTVCLTGLLSCYFLYTGWFLSTVDFPSGQRVAYGIKAAQLEKSVGNYLGKSDIPMEDVTKIETNLDAQKKLLTAMTIANRNGDWKSELDDAVEQLKLEQSLTSMGVLSANPNLSLKLEQNRYFQNHSIRPKNSDSACDGLNVLVMISHKFLPALVPLCVLLLSLSAWLSEKRSGPLKLLLWQARPKRKILLDKFFTAWVESMAAIAASCLTTFLICWTFFGFGLVKYPVFAPDGQVRVTGDVLVRTAAVLPAETFVFAAACSLIAGWVVLKPKSA